MIALCVPSTSGVRKTTKYTLRNAKYRNESSSDEDDEYSLHDSSKEGCFEEFLLSAEEEGTYFEIQVSVYILVLTSV